MARMDGASFNAYRNGNNPLNGNNFTKLTATPSASMRAISFIDVPVITPEEFQAAQTIQGLKTSAFATTPKALMSDSSESESSCFSNSKSPIEHDIMQLLGYRSSASSQAKRKLNLGSQVSVQTADVNNVFKTPKTKGGRQRKSSNVSMTSSCSPSPRGIGKTQSVSPNASRYDTSLCVLTQRFIDYMNNSNDGIINLNEAAVFLEVPKRRIYDITNVLEGIDLVEKCGKNSCKWRMHPKFKRNPADKNGALIRKEVTELTNNERNLDALLEIAQQHLSIHNQEEELLNLAYVTCDDLRSIDEFCDETVIAIKAPTDSVVEVPNPADTDDEFYYMSMQSHKGKQIEAFVCPPKQQSRNEIFPLLFKPDEIKTDPESAKMNVAVVEMSPEKPSTYVVRDVLPSQRDPESKMLHSSVISPVNLVQSSGMTLGESVRMTPIADRQQFLLLEPPLDHDDYLFALEPHEGIVDLFGAFDEVVSSSTVNNMDLLY